MKVKELIEELQKFNPDGTVEIRIIQTGKWNTEAGVDDVKDTGCAMINPVLIGYE